MAGSTARSLGGMEVPIVGSDKVRWVEVTVPSARPPSEPSTHVISRNAAGCHVIPGDPTAYLIWRTHKDKPNVLELMELFPCEEFSEKGLRLVFQDALYPFAFLCKNEIQNTEGNQYLLYVLTISGVAYLFYLRSPATYISGSVFPHNELVEFDVQTPAHIGRITAVAAILGCLVIGRQDGSVGCYQLGILDHSAPGFLLELRDDVGIGRLWNLMSRGKVVGAVQDITISEVRGRKLLFVLHLDGILRIWDIANRTRILNHNFNSHKLAGSTPSKLWVSDADYDASRISLAILHGRTVELDMQRIAVCNFSFSIGDRIIFSPEPLVRDIPLEEGRLVDLKFSSDKLWILKEHGSMLYDLFETDYEMEQIFYGLQEDFVADQLFQSSEHALDDLIWTNGSIFSLMKDQVAYFISSIFLRRLLQPGVHQSNALRATILDHKKYFSDYEFQSLTVTGLRKEIFTVIEGEGVAVNSTSTAYYWKNFCAHFFRYWCQNSTPYGLFVDSAGSVIGLIRRSSISLFRSLEGIEQLIYGSSDGFNDLRSSGLILPQNNLEREILFEFLRCVSNINRQLGRAASAIFYESLVSPIISSEDVIFHLLKILETGYSPSMVTSLVPQVGVDTTWENKQAAHQSQRKFSVDMLLSFCALLSKSSTWARVLDVIDKYLNYLMPHESNQRFDSKGCYNINSLLLIQAISQVARVMFESTFDVLLLLSYLVNVSRQVHMMQSDLARIQRKLIPMIQEILTQWLVLHFVAMTPSEPQTMDDFSSHLSSLHRDNKADKIPWDGKLGGSDFPLACLLDFPNSIVARDFPQLKTFPSPSKFLLLARKFSSLVVWGRTGEEHFSFRPLVELASLLLQHGQCEASEILCDGKAPFVGLTEKVEQELAWKAERSDISTKPSLYKLPFAFESYHNNWRRAASYMYRYSVRLRSEVTLNEDRHLSSELQERLNGLAAAINALQLVDPAYAWIESHHDNGFCYDQDLPNKRARKVLAENSALNIMPQSSGLQCYVDLKMLEKEHVLTSAEYLLALRHVKFKYLGSQTSLANLVDALVQENLYDMAFTVILKFWKGSAMKRELERAFVAISEKCCPNSVGPSFIGNNLKALLPSAEDVTYTDRRINTSLLTQQVKANSHWETLELYLEKYKSLHPRLPVTVAETLLHTDP